jgi:hypothetical protein
MLPLGSSSSLIGGISVASSLTTVFFPGSDMRCPGADVEILKTKAKLSPELAKERCQTV